MTRQTVPTHHQRGPETCSVESCDRPTTRQALCYGHYKRKLRGADMESPWQRGATRDSACSIEWCERRADAHGMCEGHNRRKRTGVDLNKPWRYNESGEGRTPDGYVLVFDRDPEGRRLKTYRMKHRIVMEETLGRPLRGTENVHHLNGVRDDNHPENLELWVVSQPAGQRPADLVAWARQIIELYADEQDRFTGPANL